MSRSSVQPVQQEYDRLAPRYDRRWAHYIKPSLQAVLDALDFEGRERVLDLTCGTGALEHLLTARWPGLRLVGADLSRGMLREAMGKGSTERLGWVQADAHLLPFPSASFDALLCASSLHYFRSPVAALREARRVLRPDGRFVLVDWCDDYLSCKFCRLWLRWTDPAFHHTYTLLECRAMLQKAGFEVIEATRFKIDWVWGLMRLVSHRP